MEKELNENQLLIEIKKFTIIHPDGSIDINDEIVNDLNKISLLKELKRKNKYKYKLQYTIE